MCVASVAVLKHVPCIDPEVFLVLQGDTVDCHDAVVAVDSSLEGLAVHTAEELLESVSLLCEVRLELLSELWLSEDDEDIDAVRFILWVHELSIAHDLRLTLFVLEWKDRHSGLSVHLILVLGDNLSHVLRLIRKTVENLNLVIDRDARCLAQSLDAVSDLPGEPDHFEILSEHLVQHHGAQHTAGSRILRVRLILLVEALADLEHSLGHVEAVDLDCAVFDVSSDLVVG